MTKCKWCKYDWNTLKNAKGKISQKGTASIGINTSIELSIDDDKATLIAGTDICDQNISFVSFEIKYCPMCGRKLIESERT